MLVVRISFVEPPLRFFRKCVSRYSDFLFEVYFLLLFPSFAYFMTDCHQGLIANNKTAFFGRQFFVSSDINPVGICDIPLRGAICADARDMPCGA